MSVFLKLATIQERMISEIVEQHTGKRTSQKVVNGTLKQMRILEYHIAFTVKHATDSNPEDVASELRGLISVYNQLVKSLIEYKRVQSKEVKIWIDKVRSVKNQLDSFMKRRLDPKSRRLLQQHANELAADLKQLMIVNKNT